VVVSVAEREQNGSGNVWNVVKHNTDDVEHNL
jgi:hypothetical protein